MSCEACEEAVQIDGETPACQTERGCLIPPLNAQGQRVMELRDRLVALRALVDSGTVMRLYGAGREDLEMLAVVERELQALRKKKNGNKNGKPQGEVAE